MKLALLLAFFTLTTQAREVTILDGFSSSKKWFENGREEQSVKRLLIKLASSSEGKRLISKANNVAKSRGETLYDVIKAGRGSLTDTTLIRKFTVGSPEHIVYESESKVYINKYLTQYDALLDLAHELTHFVYRRPFNPYQKNFSLEEFIQNTIEGTGGEVQAFLTECKIASDLFGRENIARSNCRKIEEKGSFSFDKAKKLFYQVGDHFQRLEKMLEQKKVRNSFPLLTRQKASFVSSAYGIPYPVAAFEEYMSVLNRVCQNDKKRLSYFQQNSERAPSSVINELESTLKEKCDLFSMR